MIPTAALSPYYKHADGATTELKNAPKIVVIKLTIPLQNGLSPTLSFQNMAYYLMPMHANTDIILWTSIP